MKDSDIKQRTQMRRLQRVIAKMYMGYLAIDKNFLEMIVSHPKIVGSSNKNSSAELVALATVCYRDLMYLQDHLRMRRPLYVTLFKRRNIPKGHKMMIKQERKLQFNSNIIEADFLLHRLHDSRFRKDYLAFFGLIIKLFFPFFDTCYLKAQLFTFIRFIEIVITVTTNIPIFLRFVV